MLEAIGGVVVFLFLLVFGFVSAVIAHTGWEDKRYEWVVIGTIGASACFAYIYMLFIAS